MKVTTLIFGSLFLLIIPVFTQERRDVWKEIIPLHSSKKDVERRFGEPMDSSLGMYERNGERIVVEYSKSKCIEHGWNITPETVISYSVYPRSSQKLSDLNIDASKLIYAIDDGANYYYTDTAKGIQYITNSFKEIKYINYIPTVQDNVFRCKGFPKYDPLRKAYRPIVEFRIDNINKDLVYFEGFIYEIKQSKDLVGYIFVYLKKGLPVSQSKIYLRRIKTLFYNQQRLSPQQIKIDFGGYRDSSQVEVFLLFNNKPAPIAFPKYADLSKY